MLPFGGKNRRTRAEVREKQGWSGKSVCVCVCVCVRARARAHTHPMDMNRQVPLSMEFSRQEYWSA